MKNIILLGSTGSIGRQTLKVVDRYPELMRIVGMSCNSNIELFNAQIAKYLPKYVFIADSHAAKSVILPAGVQKVDSLEELAVVPEGNIVLTAVVGACGLKPTVAAILASKDIALANKETLVACGDYIMSLAKRMNVKILPVDSEHSAIWQSTFFNNAKDIKRLILTASGGAFRDKTIEELKSVRVNDALKHPTWNMGVKITIDCASMMNKGLEVIEAKHLFGIDIDNIDVLIHKQSIIHSMVEYADNSIIAQMSSPDMSLPIQLALTYPDRLEGDIKPLDLAAIGTLSFCKPDYETFRCLKIARECGKVGGLYPAVMNAANEIAVDAFICNKISFLDISYYIDRALQNAVNKDDYTPDDVLEADAKTRIDVQNMIG